MLTQHSDDSVHELFVDVICAGGHSVLEVCFPNGALYYGKYTTHFASSFFLKIILLKARIAMASVLAKQDPDEYYFEETEDVQGKSRQQKSSISAAQLTQSDGNRRIRSSGDGGGGSDAGGGDGDTVRFNVVDDQDVRSQHSIRL